MERGKGIIKAYLPVRGIGFIGREGAPDLFFRVIECVRGAKIRPGVPVEFSGTTDERGRPKAAHVELVGASKRNMWKKY